MHQKPAKAHPHSVHSGISSGQRNYLYVTAAVAGMVIMIVEILGAKMLAPYVGTSHFVWTAQITVTLIALAAGYYTGGRLADRAQKLGNLYAAILAAAVYLCFTVLIIKPVANWCLEFRLAFGSLLASFILFFVPLALLAMVGPFFVRVLTQSINQVGSHVGRLASVGTIGSVIGTLLIGYVLIPFLPNSTIMLISAGTLFVVAAGHFVIWRTKRTQLAPVFLAIGAGLTTGFVGTQNEKLPNSESQVIQFTGNSNFGQLLVRDFKQALGVYRFLQNDLLYQDIYDIERRQSAGNFTYLLHGLARGYNPQISQVLCIGLGVGVVPAEFQREGVAVDVVEINPAMVPLAKKYFDCPIDKLNLTIGDGRQYLHHCPPHKYDAVILDAFLGETCPSHLMTREAFAAIRDSMTTNGVLVINTFGKFERGNDFMAASLYKTLQSVFHSVRAHVSGKGAAVFFAASDQPELKPFEYPNPASIHPQCTSTVLNAIADVREPDPASGIVLTDDFNPTDYFDAYNRELIRKGLVGYEKEFEKSAVARR